MMSHLNKSQHCYFSTTQDCLNQRKHRTGVASTDSRLYISLGKVLPVQTYVIQNILGGFIIMLSAMLILWPNLLRPLCQDKAKVICLMTYCARVQTCIEAPLLHKTEENREVLVLCAIFCCNLYRAVTVDYETNSLGFEIRLDCLQLCLSSHIASLETQKPSSETYIFTMVYFLTFFFFLFFLIIPTG